MCRREGFILLSVNQKQTCLEMLAKGMPKRQVYETFVQPYSDMTFKSFDKKRFAWKKRLLQDREKLDAANLDGKFTPYAATVQVDGKGNVVQAWVKQHADDQIEQLLAAIKDNTQPVRVAPMYCSQASGMLEIPLFDMHFGIADLEWYRPALAEILGVISSKSWDAVVITVGQDLFHNDSLVRGITSKGTPIEQVNLQKAVIDARDFYINLIDTALLNANRVQVIYSPGNHDRTVGWLFAQILKARYGSIVDDTVNERKVVWWDECFIGITHGCKGNDTAAGLRGKFTHEYPALYATAKVREIHVGHLHREGESRDEYGIQIRRISTRNKDDVWTFEEGHMSQKRFMLFEWMPGRLKSIHYV